MSSTANKNDSPTFCAPETSYRLAGIGYGLTGALLFGSHRPMTVCFSKSAQNGKLKGREDQVAEFDKKKM